MPSGSYIYDQTWQAERDRLGALEDLYDEASTARLTALGVADGWHCLEVGCGAGGVARWLATRVGATGHVVATDLDPRFVEHDSEQYSNLEVRRHDVATDALESGAYDLVHARAVLEHIPARDRALTRMVSATKPGGWVVIEDTYFGGPMVAAIARYSPQQEAAALVARILSAVEKLFQHAGADPAYGPRLPGALRAAGLEEVDAELHARHVWGGGQRDFGRLTVNQMRPHLVGAGLVTESEIDRFLELNQRSDFGYLPLPMVTAWGRRPVA